MLVLYTAQIVKSTVIPNFPPESFVHLPDTVITPVPLPFVSVVIESDILTAATAAVFHTEYASNIFV